MSPFQWTKEEASLKKIIEMYTLVEVNIAIRE